MQSVTIEIFITIAVVCIQLFFFYSTFGRIRELKTLFPENNLDENSVDLKETDKGTIEQIEIDSNSVSEDFYDVIDSTNKYLIKNRGATDFNIIKSIVERKIESKENIISSNISLPLYIGLMGTFIGIVLGLFNIAFSGGVSTQNINTFIGGVVIAMIASFFGLLLTVINNSYNFRNAKTISDERKNNFFNFLQIELLPYLENSLYDALDRLKLNINDFNKKFETNIQLFDSNFSVNIQSLGESVRSLSSNIKAVVENTNTQKEFLQQLKLLGYNRLAEANIKVFTLIKESIPLLNEFITKQKELTSLVDKTSQFTGSIESIFDRIVTFEQSINRLGENISGKEYLGNEVLKRIDENLRYLDKQFELLKIHEINSSQKINDFFTEQYGRTKELTEKIKREVETALDLNIDKNPFQRLLLLETIDNHLSTIKEKIDYNGEFKQISDYLSSTKGEIQEIKQKLVFAIEENKKKNTPQTHSVVGESENGKQKEVAQKEKTTFVKRFTNIFRWKRGRKA